jgi:hypothetical protein
MMKSGRKALPAVVVAAVSVIMQAGLVAPAGAEAPDFLLRMPATQTTAGEGAAELGFPISGVAGDPDTGRVFIAEFGNNRISEYTAWGFFVKAWGWGVADGAPELQTCGPPEPQEEPDPALCQGGSGGEGAGQLSRPLDVAVDSSDNLYVHEWINLRVQKFSPEGEFLLMFGGGVNQGPIHPGDVCTATHIEEGDTCGAGSEGDGSSHLDSISTDHLAHSPVGGGAIVVGDKGGIEIFNLDGTHRERIAFEGPLSSFAGQSVTGLDVDKNGNIYFTLSDLPDVYKLSPAGAPLAPGAPGASSFKVVNPLGVAVDADGNVYSAEFKAGLGRYVLGYDADGSPIAGMTPDDEFAKGADLRALAVNQCAASDSPNLYLSRSSAAGALSSFVEAYGPAPTGCEPPPERPPEIVAQFATTVGLEEATVKAEINPLFWPDATYYVEYGMGPCSAGGCPTKVPLSPAALTDKSINTALATAGVVLEGLEPQATYHFRFVAQSSGGGPVFGIDPDGREGPTLASESEGLEATFRTFRVAGKAPSCASNVVRIGPSAQLPDCRAYEMVSPLDKAGGDVAQWEAKNGVLPAAFETHTSAASGGRFTYTSFLAFGEAEAAPFASQHVAERAAGGWRSEPISPPRSELPVSTFDTFNNEFQGFTEDLCRAWVRTYSMAPLSPEAIAEYPNLYRRDNCLEPPKYTAVTTEKPLNFSPSEYIDLMTKGFSRDGSHTIFATGARLENTGAPKVEAEGDLLYEHIAGELRFVCHLPNGKPSSEPCSAGSLVDAGDEHASLRNAISDDGSRIFWTAYSVASADARKPGRIFVRIDGTQTRRISTTKASDPAFFWSAAADGSKAIFSFTSGPFEDQLYEVDVETETPTLIAKGVEGPMGASEDASRIYFASSEDLDAGGPATLGEHNLYLYEASTGGGPGETTFVMELGGGDVSPPPPFIGGIATKPVHFVPSKRAARISPDGLHATFMSIASPTPTGYDNRDAATGDPVAEVYLYDAAEERLRCVSCNPTGARPTAQTLVASQDLAAAQIQGWEQRLHAPRVLSDDGTRVFFESFEALAPRDTNGTWDVYQWEEAGKGTCTAASETFSEDSGGCVDLISAGTSPAKSTFLDADPSGDNIFFSTQSSLVGPDYGLNDVYVARVGGGFPEPVVRAPCAGEACQSPPPPPPDVTPSTRIAAGPGNVRGRCPKGKRKVKRAGKVRCVKRKKAKGKGVKAKARKARGAGR